MPAQTAVQNELAVGHGVATEAQRRQLGRAARRLQLVSRSDVPLHALAGLTMAVARHR